MELKNLRTLLTVADQGSYQKAADTLGYTQSTVTVHIQQLEQELGVPLFQRTGRRMAGGTERPHLRYSGPHPVRPPQKPLGYPRHGAVHRPAAGDPPEGVDCHFSSAPSRASLRRRASWSRGKYQLSL